MKKVLVTGATGFVGYHVARQLVERNWGEIYCLARPNSERKFLHPLNVKIVEGDLLKLPTLERAMDGVDTLFHVAADYRLWSKNPQEIIEGNVRGTENVLSAARKRKVAKIVYTSSVSAVGRPEAHSEPMRNGMSAKERTQWEKKWSGNETLDPTGSQQIGPYKKSKFFAELVARRFAKEGTPVVIVNPSTPMGSHDSKPTPTGKMILDFLNGKMPAYLDTGLNLIAAEDCAIGHLLAAEKGRIGERYILGHKNMMLKEILEELSRITGLPAPKVKIPYWIAYASGWVSTCVGECTGKAPAVPLDAVRMAQEMMFYDSSKAVRELGLPQTSIEAALKRAVDFFVDNGYVEEKRRKRITAGG